MTIDIADVLDGYELSEGGLIFYQPLTDDEVDETYLPWGPVAPGSSADKRIRVHNDSTTYIARGVSVTVTGPEAAGAVSAAGQHLLSADGLVFTGRIDVGDLPPGATSAPVWLRRITEPGTALGDASFLLIAAASAWIPAVTGDGDVPGGGVYDPGAYPDPVAAEREQM